MVLVVERDSRKREKTTSFLFSRSAESGKRPEVAGAEWTERIEKPFIRASNI